MLESEAVDALLSAVTAPYMSLQADKSEMHWQIMLIVASKVRPKDITATITCVIILRTIRILFGLCLQHVL